MGNERSKRIWGQEGRSKRKPGCADPVDRSKAADQERLRCRRDLKYFYQKVLAQGVTDKRTKLTRAESIGKIHDLMMDFLTFELSDEIARYSALPAALPERAANGQYPERWLYFPKLDGIPPSVQDGPDGPVSHMFYEEDRMWHGVIVRIKGDALTKCILVPRGHLKSTICNHAFNLWQIVRDPSMRLMIRSLTSNLAKSFLGDVKFQFEMNPRFRRLFGDLGPPEKREMPWNTEFIQVRADERRGKEPTLSAHGMESELTGGHFDAIVLDDVVGESNTKTATLRADASQRIQRLQAVRDPDTPLIDIGTRWESDDVHSMFLSATDDMAEDCSFMVATVVDADNNPIWPEKFSPATIARQRRAILEDKIYFGQYFNQFTGTTARTFSMNWITHYEGAPLEVARAKQLNIHIGIDTAAGKDEQANNNTDFTAALVLGQTPDRMSTFVLDGFCERLPADGIPKAIVDLAMKWRQAAMPYGGTFSVGVEETAYTNFLHVALDYETRERGVDSVFSIVPLKHNKVSKKERIRILARPYSDQRILWPHTLDRAPHSGGNPYNLIEILREQYRNFPSVSHDDLLDAHAYAYQLSQPRDYIAAPQTKRQSFDPSRYSRSDDLPEPQDTHLHLSGYDDKHAKWGLL